MEIFVNTSCKNAPKKERTIDLVLAFIKKDEAVLKTLVTKDFTYHTVGDKTYYNLNNLSDFLNSYNIEKITIDNALSHGNGAMAEGIIILKDTKNVRFCLVTQFKSTLNNALIKSAHCYFV